MKSDHKKLNKENFFKFSVSAEKKIKHILSKYPDNRKASAVLPILDIAQRESGGWLPIKAIEEVASEEGSSDSKKSKIPKKKKKKKSKIPKFK